MFFFSHLQRGKENGYIITGIIIIRSYFSKISLSSGRRRSSNIQDRPSLEERAASELCVLPLIAHHSGPRTTWNLTGGIFLQSRRDFTLLRERRRLNIGYLSCLENLLRADFAVASMWRGDMRRTEWYWMRLRVKEALWAIISKMDSEYQK